MNDYRVGRLKEYVEYNEKEDIEYVINLLERGKKEIERLNNKVEELMTLYTTERHVKEDYKTIIKEVREWIVKNSFSNGISSSTFFMPNAYANKLLEILDKVDKENK